MKILCLFLLLIPVSLQATTLTFDVDPADTMVLHAGTIWPTGTITLHSAGLNGTVFDGQNLSVDSILGNDVLVRVDALSPGRLGIGLMLQTNANTFPGFFGPAPGYLLGPDGSQFGNTLLAGRAAGDNGTTFMCLVLFTPADLYNLQIFDISGVHFDTRLPTTGFTVTDAILLFSFYDNTLTFGTAAQLSEPSSFVLMAVGLAMLWLFARKAKKI